MNKKILAILMALLMVLTSVAAFAEEGGDATTSTGNQFTITKNYESADATLVPGEKVYFTATFDNFVSADANVTSSSKHPTYTGDVVAVVGANTVTITGTGEFDAAGKYYYTLSETEGSVQGVSYGDETISVILTVGYKDGALTLLDVGVAKIDGQKNGVINNKYEVGGVEISKTVTGNAANLNDTFNAVVTITAADTKVLPSEFTINYTDAATSEAKDVKLTKDAATFNVTLKQGTNVVINKLPLGAIVTVAENDTKVNGANEKDASKYDASYVGNGVAAAATAPVIAVTNTRTTSIDTGVNTDSMPYFMLMAFVMILAAAVVLKKRTVNE